jgi:hypothetical protein
LDGIVKRKRAQRAWLLRSRPHPPPHFPALLQDIARFLLV